MSEYKEILPSNCPPPEAIKQELVLFRIVKNETLNVNDFEPYTKLYPDRKEYKTKCMAYALSFYTNIEKAKRTLLFLKGKNADIGNFILEVKIKEEYGKMHINDKTSHCSLWVFKETDISKFDTLKVYEVTTEK